MAQKNITTIAGLAEMMQRTMAIKADVQALDKKITGGFERIEYLLLAKQEQRLTDLGTRMKTLEDAPAVEPKRY